MFLRFAGKAPAPWLGLLAALLPAPAAMASTATQGGAAPAPVTPAARLVVSQPTAQNIAVARIAAAKAASAGATAAKPTAASFVIAKRGAVSAAISAPVKVVIKSKTKTKTKAVPSTGASQRTPDPYAALHKQLNALAAKRPSTRQAGPRTHAAGPDDFNIDADSANQIEPQFAPGGYTYVMSSDQLGIDLYPQAKTNEPAFLAGADFHLYYRNLETDNINHLFNLGLTGDDRGEQFEPTLLQPDVKDLTKYRMAWSAFVPDTRTEYKPSAPVYKDDSGNDVTYDTTAQPVRLIQYSDDAFASGGPAITQTLPSTSFGFIQTPNDPTATPPTFHYAPLLVPDSSPAIFPGSVGRTFIVFVTLRGYDPKDPKTHYSSLWVWDTSQAVTEPDPFSAGNPRKFLSIPGKSILQPKFRDDGTIAFTVADVSFEVIADGLPGAGQLPDLVWDIDVTKKALLDSTNNPFIKSSRVYAAPVALAAGWPAAGTTTQVTTFTDATNAEPRDMFPFWSPLGQLGFSTDRIDSDDDDFADAIQTDPTKATFSIYTFQFAYDPALPEDVTVPDQIPQRETLGVQATKDDSNELYGAWLPLNEHTSSFGAMQPAILYQADNNDAKAWDIWMTDKTTFPMNGNLLIGLPVVTGDPDLTSDLQTDLAQTRRVGLPGDYVTISVQVNPNYITDTTKVKAIIKDPDKRQDGYSFSEVNPNAVVPVWQEYGMWPVEFTGDDLATYTQAFGSSTDPPSFGAILDLQPDTVKGGTWYTGKWFTPNEVSDYIIDVAVDSQETDNIGGFSTSPFVPESRILLVSDFAAGQRSIYATSDTQTTAGIPVESFFTHRNNPDDVAGWGSVVCDTKGPSGDYRWSPLGPRFEWQTAPERTFNSATGRYDFDFSNAQLNGKDPAVAGLVSWKLNDYDLWRTQCREPITLDDLRPYLPYTHTQPGLPTTPTVARNQRVADRAVFWMAPHADQLNGNGGANSAAGNGGVNNKGVGTIANLNTQIVLRKFLDSTERTTAEITTYGVENGRMMISGDDVGYALTQNGVITNPVMTRFGVAFESHYADSLNGYETHREELISVTPPSGGPFGYHGIVTTAMQLAPFWAFVPGSSGSEYWQPRVTATPVYQTSDGSWLDGAWNQMFIDSVTAVNLNQAGGSQIIYNYGESNTVGNTDVAGVRSWLPLRSLENTSNHKTIYYAFGLEGINRHYYIGGDTLIHTENRPALIFHNAADWLTTGSFSGKVFLTNNVTTLPNVLVYAVDEFNAEAAGSIQGTALTADDGSYFIDGLDTGFYALYAYKTGYSFQNPVGQVIDAHGTGDPTALSGVTPVNLLLSPVEPGTLSGFVKDKSTSAGINGIVVKIHDIQNTVSLQTTTVSKTDPSNPAKTVDGWYEFNSIPAGLYVISTDEQTVASVDYAAYTNDGNPKQVVTDPYITPGDTRGDTSFNITLTARVVPPTPATLQVTVMDDSVTPSVPAVNATVTVIDPATGKAATTVDGSSNPNTTPDNGVVVFQFIAGTYLVKAEYTNGTTVYKAQSKTVLLPPDDAVPPTVFTKITFDFGGVLHTFTGNSILMASVPYDYSGTTTAPMTFDNFIGLTATQLKGAIVAYDATAQAFAVYPTYPADTGRIGRGYGFKLPADGKITQQGTAVTSSTAIVRTDIGWNLIGDPYADSVVWNGTDAHSVKVALRDDANQTLMTIDDAMTKGYILSALWGGSSVDTNGNSVYNGTYTVASGTATIAPWQAYWVKVAQPLLFYVPQPVAATSVKAAKTSTVTNSVLMPAVDTWGVNVTATADSLTDSGLALGIARRATANIDAGLDLAKPTPMGAGYYLFTSFPMGNAGTYATDIRGLADANVWTFTVNTNLNARPVTIKWTPTGVLPAGYSAVLVDTATGQRTNMSAVNQYAFRSARDGGVRTFRVEVRRASVNR
jgi:hypothetical protein